MPDFAEMYFSTRLAAQRDGLVWKPVLRTGVWNVGPNGRPLRVVAGKSSDPREAIGLQDIVENYEAGAIEHVTIPKSHEDKVDENTGFINRLRVRPGSDGVHYLMAGHRFTENDIERKVLNGSIANTSVGLEFDYVRKEDGKRFPVVLRHVALTNRPWINRLTPFGVNASEEDYNIFSMQFSEPLEDEPGLNKRQTILSIPKIANKIGQLTDLHITQINGDCVGLEDDNYIYSAKFSVSDGTVTLANRDTWETTMKNDPAEGAGAILSEPVNSEEEMSERRTTRADENREVAGVSLSEFEAQQAKAAALQAQVDQLLADKRNTTSNEFVTKLKSLGFTEDKGCTAFLKKARSIILSDEGKSVLMLSEDEGSTPKPYTATELITDLFASLPEDKNIDLNLSQQHTDPFNLSSDNKPNTDDDPERRVELSEEDADKMYEQMFGEKPRVK